jgi:hypothetical protein
MSYSVFKLTPCCIYEEYVVRKLNLIIKVAMGMIFTNNNNVLEYVFQIEFSVKINFSRKFVKSIGLTNMSPEIL